MSSGSSKRPKSGSRRSTPSEPTTGSGATSRSPDFEEWFACLNAEKVKALVVGGYAVAFHARPRHTKDRDLLLDPSPANRKRLIAALERFGFGGLGLTPEDFATPN